MRAQVLAKMCTGPFRYPLPVQGSLLGSVGEDGCQGHCLRSRDSRAKVSPQRQEVINTKREGQENLL